jgi:hypothetical protein
MIARPSTTARHASLAAAACLVALSMAWGQAEGDPAKKPWAFSPPATPAPPPPSAPPEFAMPETFIPPELILVPTTPIPAASLPAGEGPRDVPLVEKRWEDLSDKKVGTNGALAMAIEPTQWKHAETENFILHYRRVTEAQKVAREVEYDLWFIAKTMGATKEQYQRKSHVFVFEDDAEWRKFLAQTTGSPWAGSLAFGDQLFLNVRRSFQTGRFDSMTLAHEVTHAVVARLFPLQQWPLWLNEGWAEYMGGASVAARKGQTVKRQQSQLYRATLPLDKMEAMIEYPKDEVEVDKLYQTSEKVVRFLMNEMPQDRIMKFITTQLTGKTLKQGILEVYGDKLKDWETFEKRFERFDK